MSALVLAGFASGIGHCQSDAVTPTQASETAQTRMVSVRTGKEKPKDRPTRLLTDLKDYKPVAAPPALTAFGGWKDKKVAESGFFRAKKIGERWWLVDPTGCLYLSVGMNAVSVSTTPSAQGYLKTAFGTKEKWADSVTTQLTGLGFNTAGCWSDTDVLAKSAPQRLPYTRIWNFMSAYGKQRGGTFQQSGHVGYPHDAIFVFDPEFEPFCDEYAKQLTAGKNDPYLLGHFSDNELPFGLAKIEDYLALDAADPGRKAVEAWMKDRKIASVATLTDTDQNAWRGVVADRYFAITTKAIRKYDPNHLCLGSRIHGRARKSEGIFQAAGKYLDVIAVNDYTVWTPTRDYIGQWTKWSGKPVVITEWYAKGDDSGMGNTGGAGWTVPTQKERGWFYQNYTLGLLEAPNCVGWHWFKYADNDPTNIAADPSNRDSNKGIVNIKLQEYAPLVDAMRELNRNVYPLTQYFESHPPTAATAATAAKL